MAKKNLNTNNIFTIEGGTPLHGCVRVGGAKNASYKLMIASLLSKEQVRLLNLPDIADVRLVSKIINELGGNSYTAGEKTYFIEAAGLNSYQVSPEHGESSRSSTLFIPVLLNRLGEAIVPFPGGDKIGKRPLERHFDGLVKLGATWELEKDQLHFWTKGLVGTTYRFDKNTHTGTETLIMAAVMAKGKTVLENAAEEPEIDDLIALLNAMGARIRRRSFRIIEIEGVPSLHGAIHKIMPDRNEAVSYACAALTTKGDIIIENARHQDLTAFIDKVQEAGGGVEIGNYGVRFYYDKALRATDVVTEIHPGFMTDWQPLWAVAMCTAKGVSIIHETVMQQRFQYTDTLEKMGAKFEKFNPEVHDPDKFYNFNWSDHKEGELHALKIFGPVKFKGGKFEVHDLRAGATTLLAAIAGTGTTILTNIEQIDRGYEEIDLKLRSMGAKITRS